MTEVSTNSIGFALKFLRWKIASSQSTILNPDGTNQFHSAMPAIETDLRHVSTCLFAYIAYLLILLYLAISE